MRKFLAVVKHEYKKIVLKWSFILGTLLFPIIAAGFAVVPAIIFSIKGEPTRIAVVDQSGKLAERLKGNLSAERMSAKANQAMKDSMKNLDAPTDERMKKSAEQFVESFIFTDYAAGEKPLEQIRRELSEKVSAKELDAYMRIPKNLDAAEAKYEFRSRKAGDLGGKRNFEDALNEAVRAEKLASANVSETQIKDMSRNVAFDSKSLDEKGGEKNSDGIFFASLIIGLMIYITLAIYGQMILAAVVEEKETRIAEILLSSARPFELMMGKLVGVGLAGLTQLAIWIGSAALLLGFLAVQSGGAAELVGAVPSITPLMVILFFVYFLLGFFIYASIFALIGSMVTTVQEGGQFSFPPIMLLLVGFYFSFAVIRDPNSSLSFWVSIAPFFAPITMPVRILAETPPLWQIGLSIFINAATIAGLIWLASRVYRVGMLMYGKRATIPEVWKWIRQA